MAKPSQRAKTYWNEECTAATAKAKGLIKQAAKYRNQETLTQLKEAQEEKERTIKKAKQIYFRSIVYDLAVSPRGVWKLAKYNREQNRKPKLIPKFPPFKKPNSTIADTFNSKIEAFKKVFFPPPPDANLADIDDITYPNPVKLDRLII